jgi:hypothetical protein
MAYQVDRYNGVPFSEVPDQTIDSSSSDLRFVGKNYAGYGEILNENFLHLLENFRGDTPPRKSIAGQLWYDELNNKLRIKTTDGQFRFLSIADVGIIPPTGLQSSDTGNFWYDSSRKQIYVWDGADFALIGPEIAVGFDETKLSSGTIRDDSNIQHEIIKVNLDGDTIATIASDTFDIGAIDQITGFTKIRKGITLVNTPDTGVTTDDHTFWGTASNTLKFQGLELSNFVLRSPGGSTYDDAGLTIGDSSDLKISVVSGDQVVLANQLGNTIRVRITQGSVDEDIAIFSNAGFYPGDDISYDIGNVSKRYREVHAEDFFGRLTGTAKGNVLANDDTVLIDGANKFFIGISKGTHEGDIKALDASIAYDASTKTFDGVSATFTQVTADTINLVNRLVGDLQGDAYASDGTIAYNAGTKTFFGTFSGIADSAGRLASQIYINGVAFDGSSNITVLDNTKVSKSGDTIVGNITGPAPSLPGHLANKQYVDDAINSRDLYLSLDTRGLNETSSGAGSVVSLLNTLIPPGDLLPGTRVHVAGTSQNVTSSASYGTRSWIGITTVTSVSVSTTVSNPSRNNDLIYRVNTLGNSWEYVQG